MGTELNLWYLENGTIIAGSDRVATAIPLRLSFLDDGPRGFERLTRHRAGPVYSSAYGSFAADAERRVFVVYVAEDEIGGARGVVSLVERVKAAWPG